MIYLSQPNQPMISQHIYRERERPRYCGTMGPWDQGRPASGSNRTQRMFILPNLPHPHQALPLAHFFLRDLPPAMAAFILASLDFCTLELQKGLQLRRYMSIHFFIHFRCGSCCCSGQCYRNSAGGTEAFATLFAPIGTPISLTPQTAEPDFAALHRTCRSKRQTLT